MALSAHKQFPVTNLVMYFDPANRKSYSSGTAITDLSSARNNGVLTNGPTFTNILGGYITLDGTNDSIEITRTGDFNVSTNNACCCLWFRANVINAGNALIFSNYKGSSSSFNIYQWSTGKVTAYFRDSSLNVASMDSMNNLSDGRWHFVCAQRTGTTTFELYIDGQIDNSTTTANISNIDLAGASNITIGVLGGSGQQYLNGDVGAVWYYSSSLTAAQINQIYQSTKQRYSDPMPTVRRGLIMNLDASNPSSYAGVGTVWYDISGNNNHVTLFNGVSFSGSGQSGYFYFDGTNDYAFASYSDTVTEGTFVFVGYPDGPQQTYAGLIYDRGSATGLQYYSSSNFLGYNWNNTFDAGQFSSGLTMPNNAWFMATAAVEPAQSRLSLNKTFAYNNVAMASHSYANIYIGSDPGGTRYFKGKVTKALIYDRALNQTEILSLYRQFASQYHTIPQQNLILHLDAGNKDSYSGSGTSWYEISGSGSTATLTNSPTFTSTYGGGFVLNGTSQYATVPTASRFDLSTGSATIIAWFKTTASGLTNIVSKRNGTGFQLHVYNNNLYADGAGTAGKSSSQIVNTGKIFCGAVVYDRASSLMRLYINGVEDGNVALPATTLTDVANVNVGYTTFGGSPGYFFNGTIYQVQIYNKALSPKEMRENFELMRSRYGV